MISDFPVIVDACVLVQAAVRDTLLRLFERRLSWLSGRTRSSKKPSAHFKLNLAVPSNKPITWSANCVRISPMLGSSQGTGN